jgi:hypothetical protein
MLRSIDGRKIGRKVGR